MRNKLLLLAIMALPLMACSSDEDANIIDTNNPDAEVVTILLSDKDATAETKALYSNLWVLQQKGFMFGHHDDLWYGRYWYATEGGSDTKAVCGDYPAVFSCDFAEVMDNRHETSAEAVSLRKRCIIEARRRGEVIIACAHLNNPLTGGDSWDNSNSHVVEQILTDGSETNKVFKSWLDNLIAFALELKDDNNLPIPIIFRPFHEHTQNWSWWGSSCTTETQFINLWKFTVDYLKNSGIHQFIYAISPQMDTQKRYDDFLYRWPGDEYVDFIGMDCYHGINNPVFSSNLLTISKVSQSKKKPCGVTEIGLEGFSEKKYWTENILSPATGRKISLIVTWRNKYVGTNENDRHFFSVFPGHPSENDFKTFYSSPLTYFSKDLPNMYEMADGINVK